MTVFMYVTVPISGFVTRAVGRSLNPEEWPGQVVIQDFLKENVFPLLLPKYRGLLAPSYIPSSDGSYNCVITEKKGSRLCRSKPMRNLQSVILCKNNESRKSYTIHKM